MNRSLSEAQTADQIPTGVGQGADAATETLKAWLRERHAYLVGLGAKETYEGAAHAHIERLTVALATANANHERFEREWYLRGDEIERLQKRVAELEDARHKNDRVNFESTEDGLRICRGYHHRSAACEWEYYVPRPPSPPGDARPCRGGCDLTLVECCDARMKGCIKCCPDCDHRAPETKDAQPPAATHTQWERDRLATYLAKRKPALRDHACAQCVPGGEIVVEDFECCYHMALRIVGRPEEHARVAAENISPESQRDRTTGYWA